MSQQTSQTELWSHYQTGRLEVFAGSKSRLDFLVRFAGRLASGRSLLNIGCGDGYLERRAQQKKWSVISVDPDPSSISRLRSLGVDARCGLIESLPVDPQSVDVVICTEVLEHLTTDALEGGLSEIRRVLKPGGLPIGTVPYRETLAQNQVFCPDCKKTFHRWGHQQSFDEGGIRSVLGRYLKVQQARPVYFATWDVADWKGKLSISARLAFSWIGVHGANSNLLFVAAKAS
jgi:SAM-dependent methyltransferase